MCTACCMQDCQESFLCPSPAAAGICKDIPSVHLLLNDLSNKSAAFSYLLSSPFCLVHCFFCVFFFFTILNFSIEMYFPLPYLCSPCIPYLCSAPVLVLCLSSSCALGISFLLWILPELGADTGIYCLRPPL